jgi:hypothetical protein
MKADSNINFFIGATIYSDDYVKIAIFVNSFEHCMAQLH